MFADLHPSTTFTLATDSANKDYTLPYLAEQNSNSGNGRSGNRESKYQGPERNAGRSTEISVELNLSYCRYRLAEKENVLLTYRRLVRKRKRRKQTSLQSI